MPKFFVTSDIHSYFNEFITALKSIGFDEHDENHYLVVCGDCFDRGCQSEELLHYLMSLERKILVQGNHDLLLAECCMREFPYSYDISNGTVRTINDIGGAGEGYPFDECCVRTWNKTAAYRQLLVNYFETKKYLFVHSWIPVVNKDGLPAHYTRGRSFEFNPDWRNASQKDWDEATWGNPFDMVARGFMPDKTVVFGHWHCSTGWAISEGRSEFDVDAKFDPYYGDGFIAIDACTAHSDKCNVIVIEDEFLEE